MPEGKKYEIHLDNFDGPLDLLLHLIDKNKMDIYDIPIAVITEQYLQFLDEAREMDLEIASEFLLIAATLLSIKAKMLLPNGTLLPALHLPTLSVPLNPQYAQSTDCPTVFPLPHKYARLPFHPMHYHQVHTPFPSEMQPTRHVADNLQLP